MTTPQLQCIPTPVMFVDTGALTGQVITEEGETLLTEEGETLIDE